MIVDPSLDGARLDAAVAALFDVSTSAARRLCEAGRVRVGKKKGKKGDRVAAGDDVVVEGGEGWFVVTGAPAVPVLFESDELIVVDKPAGVPCHPLVPGEGGTVVDAVVAAHVEVVGASVDEKEAGLLHRLDNGTSGVLAFARSRAAWTAWRARFHDVDKVYVAIVAGVVGAPVVVDSAIGHSGKKMKLDPAGQPATTTVTPLSTSSRGHTLVQLKLEGGVRHQLRVHLASIGHPIVGDVDYGAADVDDGNFYLHAARLALGGVVVEAPLPARFARRVASLGL